jgi:hypothetical protein
MEIVFAGLGMCKVLPTVEQVYQGIGIQERFSMENSPFYRTFPCDFRGTRRGCSSHIYFFSDGGFAGKACEASSFT